MDLLKQLKDIKPNEHITDYSFYIFVFAVIAAFLLAGFIVFRMLKRKKQNPYLAKLKKLDFTDSKKTAYEFCEYARFFINDENRDFYREIEKELEQYKYRPHVEALDKKTVEKIKKFTEGLK
jgi:RecA-family ATPase